jgi:hypothetical protein
MSADASLIADPGFAVNALARVEGCEKPVVIGRLTSLGIDRASGDVVFRAHSRPIRAAAVGERAVRATLFTGAGDPGIPSGLWIGTTEIPGGEGALTLRVHAEQIGRRLQRVSVWRAGGVAREGSERP